MNYLTTNAAMQPTTRPHEKEQKMQARKHLIDTFTALYLNGEKEKLRWNGTKTDLLEAIHLIYIYGEIKDETGRLARLTHLIRFYFGMFRLQCPNNPHALIRNAAMRKNKQQIAFLERYCWQLFEKKNENPLNVWVSAEHDCYNDRGK